MIIGLHHYLVFALGLFILGLYGVLTRRNVIGVLMGIELMFNAANVNLVAFHRFADPHQMLNGQVFAMFVIVLAAAEAVVGLALVLSIYRHVRTLNVESMNLLKG